MSFGILSILDERLPLVLPSDFAEDEIDLAIHNRCAEHWMPAPEVSAEQWLRDNLKIAGNQSAGGGGMPLDLRKNPQARVVAEFLDDPFAEELNIKKSSAGGISTTIIGLCVRRLKRDPVNILYLIGNEKQAREMSDIYWRPFLRQVFGPVADAKHQSTLHFKINGVEIILGSPTEDMLRGKQFGLVVEDESDTMEDVLKGGAQNLDVAERERTKNFKGSKIIRLCCPLYEWDATLDDKVKQPLTRISRHYQAGDQREFRVPCPACDHEHEIRLEHLDCGHCMDLTGAWILDRVREETVWRCPACRHEVHDSMAAKLTFLDRGRHVPTVKAASGRVWSAQVTDLAVLFGKAASWGFVKASVLEAEPKGAAAVAGVMRSHMGVALRREAENQSRTAAMLLRHCSHYERGACPLIPWVVILSADVQKDATYFPWTLQAFNQRGDLFLLDWGEAQDTDELETIRKRPIPVRAARASIPPALLEKYPDGRVPDIYVSHACIDSGHRAKGEEVDPTATTVYRFCHQAGFNRVVGADGQISYPYRWVPMKGRGESQIEVLVKTSQAQLNDQVRLPLILFKDPAFKIEMYHYQLAFDPTLGAEETKVQAQARLLPRIVLPRHEEVPLQEGQIGWKQLLDELQAERYGPVMVQRRNGSGEEEVRKWYVPRGMANNLADCIKMARVRFAALVG